MKQLEEFLRKLRAIFEYQIYSTGQKSITTITIIGLILVIAVFLILSKYLRRLLQRRILPRFNLADGVQFVILRLIHYLLMVIGFLFALRTAGINLTSLAVFFGLVGVGIAFGLQNITSNFVSGLILLFERPIGVGDFIEVGETSGQVRSINMRATTIVTLDNITLIVPNSKFIEDTVTNWSVGDPKVRITVSVGVAYGSDTELVTGLLLKVAENHAAVLSNPKPIVLFRDFADSSLNLELRVWLLDPMTRLKTISDLNYAIDAAFRENGVIIPFPQRDVHFFRET